MATWFDNSLVAGQTLIDRFAGIATALGLLAPKASPTFTGTVTAPTFVGALTGNASTATALAAGGADRLKLDGAAPLASPTFTGVVTGTFSGPLTGNVTGNVSGNAATATSATTAGSATTLGAGADRTKLDGIAAGATANSPDATLLARANHTGVQAISTVTNLQTSLDAKAPTAAPTFTGSVTMTGGVLEIGPTAGVASTPYIDFHSGATATDFDSRIIASGGTGVAQNGTLTYQAASHVFNGRVLPNISDYLDDTAAAAAGVPLGALYRTGSTVKVRST